jgi:parvulin-like peptidyl-prolyl isomerase
MKRLFASLMLLAAVGCAETFNAAAAVVNGEEISAEELELQVDAQLEGNPSATDPATRIDTARNVLSAAIRQRLLAQEARKRGIDATTEEIDAQLAQIKSQYPDDAAFQDAVQQAGLTLDELRRRVEMQVLSNKLANDLAPDPDQRLIQETYEAQQERFREIQVKHILYQNKQRADQAIASLRSGNRSFKDLATESQDPSSADFGGVLADAEGNRPGWFRNGTLDPAFFDAAWQASPNQIVGPVQSQFGFHIIVLIKKRTAPLTAVRDEIVAELQTQTGDTALQQTIAESASRSRILINPKYGDWDYETLTIVPHESYVPVDPEPSESPSLELDPALTVGG